MAAYEHIINFSHHWYGWVTLFLVGMGLLVLGGNFLVDGGIGVANRFKVNTMVIGLTIVAFSTSSPELAFNVLASLNNHGEMSLGNIFGSNIANLSLVLGVGAIIYGQKLLSDRTLSLPKKFVKAEQIGLNSFTVTVALITLFAFLVGGKYPLFGLGWLFGIVLLGCFLYFIVRIVLPSKEMYEIPKVKYTMKSSISLLLVGLIFLGIGGKAAEISAVAAAESFGISQIFIGVTIVALATSLPEIATTVIAAKKGEPDMAVGNVIGSNFFNMLFVLPITMLVHPIPIPAGIEPWIYVVVMLLITLFATRMMKNDKDLTRKEGWVLVGSYFVFIFGLTIWKSLS